MSDNIFVRKLLYNLFVKYILWDWDILHQSLVILIKNKLGRNNGKYSIAHVNVSHCENCALQTKICCCCCCVRVSTFRKNESVNVRTNWKVTATRDSVKISWKSIYVHNVSVVQCVFKKSNIVSMLIKYKYYWWTISRLLKAGLQLQDRLNGSSF